ncbi:MAG: NUDIX domain-containing protein [Arenicellales bacterium]|jgi:predicted NUDIX family NTP pyrophosphohydrolase
MSVHSGGILPYRYVDGVLEVMLVHPGGPYWAKKDEGAWSIAKGTFEENEAPLEAARREFTEETGFEVNGDFKELGQVRQRSNKVVHVWAVESNLDTSRAASNTFSMEWPRHSGQIKEYPETDRAEWFGVDEARSKILKGQAEFLDRLMQKLGVESPDDK